MHNRIKITRVNLQVKWNGLRGKKEHEPFVKCLNEQDTCKLQESIIIYIKEISGKLGIDWNLQELKCRMWFCLVCLVGVLSGIKTKSKSVVFNPFLSLVGVTQGLWNFFLKVSYKMSTRIGHFLDLSFPLGIILCISM